MRPAIAWLCLAACSAPLDGDALGTCASAQVEIRSRAAPASAGVDLLIVVDGSMTSSALVAGLPDALAPLMDVLVTGQRTSSFGGSVRPPYAVNVAVIDMDMGIGDVGGDASCNALGDAGRFRTTSATCDLATRWPDGVIRFAHDGVHDPGEALRDVACLSTIRPGGCRFARGFDAILAALARSGEHAFATDPSAALEILVVTAQDDCSPIDATIFADEAPFGVVAPELRCRAWPWAMRDVDEVARAIIGTRAPRSVGLSIVAGIPTSLSPSAGVPTSAALLDEIMRDPAMSGVIDPNAPDRLAPVCSTALGSATPASRWVALARSLQRRGASVAIHSACVPDLDLLADSVFDAGWGWDADEHLRAYELPRALDPDADDRVPCEVLLPLSGPRFDDRYPTRCSAVDPDALHVDHVETVALADGSTREFDVCRVRQLGRSGVAAYERGWVYDDGSLPMSWLPPHWTQEISLVGLAPVPSSEIRIRCDERILAGVGQSPELGAFCTPGQGLVNGTMTPCSAAVATPGSSVHLGCDPVLRACGAPCTTDADCLAAGLVPRVCAARGFCVDPRCE